MRSRVKVFYLVKGDFWAVSQVGVLWAHVDLNHGPHPYQGCALTGLSYGPLDSSYSTRLSEAPEFRMTWGMSSTKTTRWIRGAAVGSAINGVGWPSSGLTTSP